MNYNPLKEAPNNREHNLTDVNGEPLYLGRDIFIRLTDGVIHWAEIIDITDQLVTAKTREGIVFRTDAPPITGSIDSVTVV